MHGVCALPPESPQVSQPPQPLHKPSPNNNVLPPKPAHLAAQAAAAASSFRQKKPPMPSPPLSSPPTSKIDHEVRFFFFFTVSNEINITAKTPTEQVNFGSQIFAPFCSPPSRIISSIV